MLIRPFDFNSRFPSSWELRESADWKPLQNRYYSNYHGLVENCNIAWRCNKQFMLHDFVLESLVEIFGISFDDREMVNNNDNINLYQSFACYWKWLVKRLIHRYLKLISAMSLPALFIYLFIFYKSIPPFLSRPFLFLLFLPFLLRSFFLLVITIIISHIIITIITILIIIVIGIIADDNITVIVSINSC